MRILFVFNIYNNYLIIAHNNSNYYLKINNLGTVMIPFTSGKDSFSTSK